MLNHLLHAPRLRPAWRSLLCALMLAICWLAFTPNPPSLTMENADKLQHLLAFACLAACAALTMAPGAMQAVVAAAGIFGYGIFIELVQTTLPARSGEWQDLVADAIGIAVGLAVIRAARRWRPALAPEKRTP